MKFIHSSDWHIGRQLHNVSLLEDQQHVLAQIKDYALAHEVDAIVVAGDLYDRSVPPANAVSVLNKFLAEITEEHNIPVIIISGNHDNAQRLGFAARQAAQGGLHILSDLHSVATPVIIEKQDQQIAFYGIPYCEPLEVKNCFAQDLTSFDEAHSFLVNKIAENCSSNQINVLISHCFIDGAEASESERPLHIGGADRVSYQPCLNFDYVALGHLHQPQYKGAPHIRYSGSLLKYSFSEQHQKKGITLVEVDTHGKLKHQHLPLTPLRDMRILEGELDDILAAGVNDPDNEDYIMVRLTDKASLLDPIGKLRKVYPNILHLEKSILQNSLQSNQSAESLKRNASDMFSDFYQQVQGDPMTKAQRSALDTLMQELNQEARQE